METKEEIKDLTKKLEQINDGFIYVHDFKELLIDLNYNVLNLIRENLEKGNLKIELEELINCYEEIRKEN